MYKPQPEIFGEIDGGVKGLCTAIVIQAILDYQELCDKGVTVIDNPKDGHISKNEITKFFRSSWGEMILESIGGHYTGEQIIEMLQTQAKKDETNKGKEIAAYTIKGELVATFKTFPECAQFAGLKSVGDICKCCKGHRKTAGGYVWKYI